MKYYTYENFKNATNTLIEQVKEFEPEAIIGIARGGLTLAHVMAECLNIRSVQSIRTELYDGTDKRDAISVFGECKFENVKRVLVVDDIADTGETLSAVMKILTYGNTQIEFKACTLFYKRRSECEPHYWLNETTEWIEFFWETDFKVN